MATTPKKKRKSKTAQVRHPFLYRLENGDGTSKVRKKMATVEYTTKPVEIELTAAHVRKSMKAGGAGNTSSCSVAICTYNHSDAFPHTVEGHIDFNYSRAFVVSKVDKYGLPERCKVYEHNARDIAKLNDTPGGQQKLLDRIERDGPIKITFKPHRVRSEIGRSGKGRKATGARDAMKLKGAKLRYAVYKLGSMPV
jgi:hypothetical protein